MNNFFDLFNSSSVQYPLQFKQAFRGAQYQLEFLSKIKGLSKVMIFNKTDVNISNKVKVFTNAIQYKFTSSNVGILAKCVSRNPIFIITPFYAKLLEALFSTIRGLNGNVFNPISNQFFYSFRKIFSEILYC